MLPPRVEPLFEVLRESGVVDGENELDVIVQAAAGKITRAFGREALLLTTKDVALGVQSDLGGCLATQYLALLTATLTATWADVSERERLVAEN